jgi:GH25 family lysozyme M1 (1,4-beta-N-acetylmuramidase)
VAGGRSRGTDVSSYEGTIDWAKVASGGIDFAIARTSDGLHFPDSKFAPNWSGMKTHGLVRGAYQFFRPSQDAAAQADMFLAAVGTFGPGDLPPILDVETLDGTTAATTVAQVRAWLDRVKQLTGITPAIYSSRRVWNELGNPTGFSMNDLWVANWGVSSPAMPTLWKDWTFWQDSATGTVSGIAANGHCDMNWFHGTKADLRVAAGLAPASGFLRGLAVNSTGQGYWTCTTDGGVFAFGDATWRGTAGGQSHAQPILGIVRTPSGLGYWLFGADGKVVSFGNAAAVGGLTSAASPVVGMAATSTGQGYWLVQRDGTISAFGDALGYGQATSLAGLVVGIASTPTGHGYWVAASDGRVQAFGDAVAVGNANPTQPIVAIGATPTGKGYWLPEASGTVHAFGDAPALTPAAPGAGVVSLTPTLTGAGYWLLANDGTVIARGDAVNAGSRPR